MILIHFLAWWLRYTHTLKKMVVKVNHIIAKRSSSISLVLLISIDFCHVMPGHATVPDKTNKKHMCAIICWRWWSGNLTWPLSNREKSPYMGYFPARWNSQTGITPFMWSKTIKTSTKCWSRLYHVFMFSEWVFGNRLGVSVLCQPLHIRKIHKQFHLAIQNQLCIDGWLSFGNST